MGAPGTTGWASAPRQGSVVSYDEAGGLGTVAAGDGRRFSFHCTALTDGTRQVAPGASVRFVVVAGHHGELEAGGIVVEPARHVAPAPDMSA